MATNITTLDYIYNSVSPTMYNHLTTFTANKDSLSLVLLMKGFALTSKLRAAESSTFEVQQLDARYIIDFSVFKNSIDHTVIRLQTSGLVPDYY